ncbi:MAG: ferritin-like domain-containing protein [Flammeovirgaceae bacterium]
MNTFLRKVSNRSTFEEAIQQAIDIELTTIPIYLYTYYSLIRVPDQNRIITDVTNALIDKGYHIDAARQYAQKKSLDITVYVNEASATIMNIAIEEMLRMALAANLKRALVGMPNLSIPYQAGKNLPLPGHNPPFSVPLTKFSAKQLERFKQMEQPVTPIDCDTEISKLDCPSDWTTIDCFYKHLANYIQQHIMPEDYEPFSGLPQLGPNNSYYTHNQVNNASYAPQQQALEDSDDLVIVQDNKTAIQAIKTLAHQRNGFAAVHGIDPSSEHEESHYLKLISLANELETITAADATELDYKEYFIKKMIENPTTKQYPADIQAVSNLLNAIYTYLFIMMESCYQNPLPQQSEIFNFGIHKGMIFILSSLCDFITGIELATGKIAGPTFEAYEFDATTSIKSQIIALYKAVPTKLGLQTNLLGRIESLPDVNRINGEGVTF